MTSAKKTKKQLTNSQILGPDIMELTKPDALIKGNMKEGSATYGAISKEGVSGPGKKLGAKE